MKVWNDLCILYEDNHVIVVEKPVNVLSQKDSTNDLDMITIIKKYLKETYKKPGNVYLGLLHRLDRPVGGVMVFAKTSKAASRLSSQIRNNKLEKTYYAIVHGIVPPLGYFEDYLYKMENGNTVINKKLGKLAKLKYKRLSINKEKNLSLVLISLETGRHHQIRVQFASRGYPLYGDNRYGKKENVPIALYCHKLSFKHPTKDEIITCSKNPKKENAWSLVDM